MSTNDVPGANPRNNDELAMGCWAEHADGSLIFVESTEANRVIYYMFDLKNMTQYRDAMPKASFEGTFSWDPQKKKGEKWTWHDKTPFPWDKVIKSGFREGEDFPSADHLMERADEVSRSRRRHRRDWAAENEPPVRPESWDDEGIAVDDGEPQSTAAQRVARELNLRAETMQRSNWEDRMERTMNRMQGLFGKIASALDRLPRR